MLSRRDLLAASVLVIGLGACSGQGSNPVLESAVGDVGLIAVGFEGVSPTIGAVPGIAPGTLARVGEAVADLRVVAIRLTNADTAAAAQPLVQQAASDVDAVIIALQGVQVLPQKVQLALTAAAVLLPTIETSVDLVLPAAPATAARRVAVPMTPDVARAILLADRK